MASLRSKSATPLFTLLATALAVTLAPAASAQCETRLPAQGLGPLFRHGFSTAVSGEWALVGSPGDPATAYKAGSARVYHRIAGVWTPDKLILAPGGEPRDEFGTAVAADGTWAAVSAPGAPGPGSGGYRRGVVRVYVRGPNGYVPLQQLSASDGKDGDEFGTSLAIDGNRLLVGARYADGPGGADTGAAYLFEYQGGSWVETAKLAAADGAPIDYFGQSVDLSGEVAVVGAWGDDDFGTGTGAAYVFRGPSWTQEQKLLTSDAEVVDYIGYSVAVRGDVIAVGVPGWDANLVDQGAAFIFRYSAGQWNQDQYLPGVHAGGQFGHALVLDGAFLAVSSVTGQGLVPGSGDAAYLTDNGSKFSFAGRLLAYDGLDQDRFGESLALDGAHLLVGAPGRDDGGSLAGAAYGFELPFFDGNFDGLDDDCSGGVTSFCACTAPPCGGSPSSHGCPNSVGSGGRLEVAAGSVSLLADDLVLRAQGLPPQEFGLLFMGPYSIAPFPLADGLRCVGTPLYRYPVRSTGSGGLFDMGPGLAAYGAGEFDAGGQLFPGQTWYFQAWYRNPGGGCGGGSNLTDALAVTFEP